MRKKRVDEERQCAGFTLIEILAVVVILGILAGVVINEAGKAVARARIATAMTHIRQMEDGVQMFHMDCGKYPTSLQDLITKPSDAPGYRPGSYLKKLPKDPWHNKYFYKTPGAGGRAYVIGSYGAGGQEGGEGDGKDLTCWNIGEEE